MFEFRRSLRLIAKIDQKRPSMIAQWHFRALTEWPAENDDIERLIDAAAVQVT
jgi:hypothetical protein